MKYENTRIVTFQEDYIVKAKGGGTKVLHKKGSRHAMHKGIVAILEKNKAKIKVETFDPKPVEAKLKEKLLKQRKHQVAVSFER